MRRIAALLLLLCALAPLTLAKGRGGHGGRSSSKAAKAPKAKKVKAAKAEKTVHAHSSARKDRTSVAPHDRSLPAIAGTPHTYSYRRHYMAAGIAPHSSVRLDKHGKIKRSEAAKAAFMREHPCPSTGKTSGKCPGHIVDHVRPLECGGADDKSNMQWQTTADAKAKDKTEGQCRI